MNFTDWALLSAISFLAGSILPIGSEPFVLFYAHQYPQLLIFIGVIATFANTLGGISLFFGTVYLKRFFYKNTAKEAPKIFFLHNFNNWLKQKDHPCILFFSFVPIIGDGLIIYASFRPWSFVSCFVWILLGKAIRYVLLLKAFKFSILYL